MPGFTIFYSTSERVHLESASRECILLQDVGKFIFIYFTVMIAFICGLTSLYSISRNDNFAGYVFILLAAIASLGFSLGCAVAVTFSRHHWQLSHSPTLMVAVFSFSYVTAVIFSGHRRYLSPPWFYYCGHIPLTSVVAVSTSRRWQQLSQSLEV